MATTQAPTGQKQQAKAPQTIKSLLEARRNSLAEAAGKWLDPDRLLKIALNCLIKNPELGACVQESFLQSVLQCAEWGVYPGTGVLAQAYLIPYNEKVKGTDRYEKRCQAQLSYQGLMTQVRRATGGKLQDIEARVVHEGDKFTCRFGFTPVLEHEPQWEGDEGQPLLVYALARIVGMDHPHVEVLPWARVDKIRNVSKAKDIGPWAQWPEEMAKKTALRQLVKFLPNYIELEQAIEKDDEMTVDGQVTGRPIEAGISAPPAPANVKPLRRELPEETLRPTLEFQSQAEPAVVEADPPHDPQTGEVLEEDAEAAAAMARMRQADVAAKAAAAASAPLPPVQQPQSILDMSAPDAKQQLMERMRAIAQDPSANTRQLLKAAELSDQLSSKEEQAEIGQLYAQLLKQMNAARRV